MHDWSDESVDWKGINDAARFIGLGLRKWGRVGVRDYKEKYGTVRVYLSLGWESIHSITHPGHVYNRYPDWLRPICYGKINRFIFKYINKLVVPYHAWLYKWYYKRAVKKWPHLIREILSAADGYELLDNLTPEWQATRIAVRISYEREKRLLLIIDELEERIGELEKHLPYKIINKSDSSFEG